MFMNLRKLYEKKDWKVLYVTAVWYSMMKERGKLIEIENGVVSGIEKLVTRYEQVREVSVTPENFKEEEASLEKYLKWILFDQLKTIRTAYRYVFDYFGSKQEDKVMMDFIDAYTKYVKERYNIDIIVDRKSTDVERAAWVSKNIAEKHNISVYDVIKYQHEYWTDGIKTPFSYKALAREDKAELRVQEYLAKRKGEVIEDTKPAVVSDLDKIPGVSFLKKRWNEVRNMGFNKYLTFSKTGFLSDVCRQLVDEYSKAKTDIERREVIRKYTDDYVAQIWIDRGKPFLF